MQLDLSGRWQTQEPIRVRLYADEIQKQGNAAGERWMYIGILAIPERGYGHALSMLAKDREKAHYAREVHFIKLNNASNAACHNEKTVLAGRWVQRVLEDDGKTFHFHLLGLNLSNLQELAFGTGREQDRNVYNRFFRASISYVLKTFFGANNVVVTHVFHDVSNLQHDDLFDWHAILRIDRAEPGITFLPGNIRFIDSDHRKEPDFPQDSHFIQLCDVLMGGLTQCLDARNTKAGCCEIAEMLLPLAERLTDPKRVNNPNSRYRYVRRLSMSFFPSRKLKLKELEDVYKRGRSGFYINRHLLFKDRQSGQLTLW